VPLNASAQASVSTSTLAAGGANLGNHFITASYSGDANYQATSGTLLQKVHANATVTTLSSNNDQPNPSQPVTFVATVSSVPSGAGTPTGMVTFMDGTIAIAQVPLSNGQASFTTASLAMGIHSMRAVYASDTVFAASTGQRQQVVGPTVQFSSAGLSASENAGQAVLQVTLSGSSPTPVTIDYATNDSAGTNPCTFNNGVASAKCDYAPSQGKLTFNPGENTKTISVSLVDDAYAEGNEIFLVVLSNPSGATLNSPSTATVTITDNDSVNGPNPLNQTGFFVRQHYLDFLNREPDTAGLNFWINEIDSCGANAQCTEVKRINVSAAFFLSIEFQETGYLVERMYKAAYGDAQATSSLGGQQHALLVPVVRFNQFLTDAQQISKGLVVGQTGWPGVLETNKQLYAQTFVQRPEFIATFPANMTATQFVDQLNANAGSVLSSSERTQLIDELTRGAKNRGQVVRSVAEDSDLVANEKSRAFVLMEYFGYLRRNPNDSPDVDYTGYDFWLTKLNDANGNFVQAEMVKAFLLSDEYRHRFGP
jgi:hypothetical protein